MISDHGMSGFMEEIQISKFKATCLAVLDRVGKTRKPLLVTPVRQAGRPGPAATRRARQGIGSA